MTYWLLPSNQEKFDVGMCFAEHQFVYWKQRNKFQIGDIAFIYNSGKEGSIRYIAVVEETDLPYDEEKMGFERKYWKVDFDAPETEMKLRLLTDITAETITYQDLRNHGLKGNLQGPQTLKGSLLEYLKNFVDDTSEPQTKHTTYMKEGDLAFTHRVDKSFLKWGFTLSKNMIKQHKDYIEGSIGKEIQVIFEGEHYVANFNNYKDGGFQLRFLKPLATAFQKKFTECYTVEKDDIVAKAEVVVNVGFYKTAEENTFVAKRIGEAVVVDAEQNKKDYQSYLEGLHGKFAGYVKGIDKTFVKDMVKDLYGLPSVYYVIDPDEVVALAEEIKSDPKASEEDEKTSHRTPTASLAKYAEFLRTKSPKKEEGKDFEIEVINEAIKESGLIFDPKFVERYICALLTKPFVVLSGLTGSGKTQLAMAFPKLICRDKSQYKLIPVGADWTNREQLLGYPNALRPGEYVLPDNGALQLIIKASKPENQHKPYFLILDEMNMSYVERYFADFLSAMESGEDIPLWKGNEEVPASVRLPKNLFIIGTINVDETTYMFSPKVLDRANVIEFRINKKQMTQYLDGVGSISDFSDCSEYASSFVAKAKETYYKELSKDMKATLINMFDTLGRIQKEFGYRTAHEMSRFITICKCYTDMSDEEAIDAAMVQKLLPKVHGSRKKISPVLTALWPLCYKTESVEIDTLDAMPALDAFKYPLTAEKIWRMYQIAQDNGFTSFAEA